MTFRVLLRFFPTFLIFFIFSLLLFVLSRYGFLTGISGFFENFTVPVQRGFFGLAHLDKGSEIEILRKENSKLASQIAKQDELKRENRALRDQFRTVNSTPSSLLPANVIGVKGDKIIIDKGENDNVTEGKIVVFEDNLIGKVINASRHLSAVQTISGNTSLTARTVNSPAQGILIGENGLTLQKVILSEKLAKGDLVVTKGDVDSKGSGFPPGLVIGKIESVEKKQSSLFQSAEVMSLVDFSRLSTVFIIISN